MILLLTIIGIAFTLWVAAQEFLPKEPWVFFGATVLSILLPWISTLVALIYYFLLKPVRDK